VVVGGRQVVVVKLAFSRRHRSVQLFQGVRSWSINNTSLERWSAAVCVFTFSVLPFVECVVAQQGPHRS
jgi:hypothetical protein